MTDPALLGRDLHVVGVGANVPAFFRQHAALHDDLADTMRRARRRRRGRRSAGSGIAGTRLGGEAERRSPAMVELLERHRRIRR